MAAKPSIQSALVIGGCGVLGHRMVTELLKLDPAPQVSVFDLRTAQNRVPSVEYHDVDITDKDAVLDALRKVKPQVIFHTASPPPGLQDLDLYLRVNVEGTRNLLDAAKQLSDTKAFVYTSSASVVHDAVSDLVDGDDSLPLVYLPKQKEVYTHSKALADQLVLDANSTAPDGMLTASIRPSGIFGEHEGTAKGFVDNAAAGKLKNQIGDGKNLFDFTYIENVIYAHVLAAQCLLARQADVAGEGFLITNDEHIPFWDFARAIAGAAGYPVKKEEVRSIPIWVGLAMAVIAEWIVWLTSFGRKSSRLNKVAIRYSCMTRTYRIDKAKKALGYRPRVSLEEGISRSGKSLHVESKKEA